MAGRLPAVQLLLASGADPNVCEGPEGTRPSSPLSGAAGNGHLEVVDVLLKAGARVDEVCGDGTALHAAVSNGHEDVARRLINAGADAKALTGGGWTYLMLAAIAAEGDTIPTLVDAGCPLEATRPRVREAIDDVDGETALMMAAGWDPAPTRALISAGANVNARDGEGATPLIHAVKGAVWTDQNGPTLPGRWHISIVIDLLAAGADPDAADSSGRTALDYAREAGAFEEAIRDALAGATPIKAASAGERR